MSRLSSVSFGALCTFLLVSALVAANVARDATPASGQGSGGPFMCNKDGRPAALNDGATYGPLPSMSYAILAAGGAWYPGADPQHPTDEDRGAASPGTIFNYLLKTPRQDGKPDVPRFSRVSAGPPANQFEADVYSVAISYGRYLGAKISAYNKRFAEDRDPSTDPVIPFNEIQQKITALGESHCFYYVFVDFALKRPLNAPGGNTQDIIDAIKTAGMRAITNDTSFGAPGANDLTGNTWAHSRKLDLFDHKGVGNTAFDARIRRAIDCTKVKLTGAVKDYEVSGCSEPILLNGDRQFLSAVHRSRSKSKAILKFEIPGETYEFARLDQRTQKILLIRLAQAQQRTDDFTLIYPLFVPHPSPMGTSGDHRDGFYNSMTEGTGDLMLKLMRFCSNAPSGPCK